VEDTSDEGFPGVALVTELPRFNIESEETPSLSEEEEDVVSSEAFRMKLQQKFKSFKQRHNNVFNKGFKSPRRKKF